MPDNPGLGPPRSALPRRPGLTPGELLAAVLIVCCLCAALAPGFAAARQGARAASCAENERRLGLALLQYAQDNDGAHPSGLPNTMKWAGVGWAGQIYRYVGSAAPFHCPADAGGDVSYAFNADVAGLPVVLMGDPARTVSLAEVTGSSVRVASPGEAGSAYHSASDFGYNLATSDMAGAGRCCGDRDGVPLKYVTGGSAQGPRPGGQEGPARHPGGSYVLLEDGHVRFLPASQIDSGRTYLGDCRVAACYSPQ